MRTNNDLERIETTLLEGMIKAYSADYGRLLSTAELADKKKTFVWLNAELKSRKKQMLNSSRNTTV